MKWGGGGQVSYQHNLNMLRVKFEFYSYLRSDHIHYLSIHTGKRVLHHLFIPPIHATHTHRTSIQRIMRKNVCHILLYYCSTCRKPLPRIRQLACPASQLFGQSALLFCGGHEFRPLRGHELGALTTKRPLGLRFSVLVTPTSSCHTV